MSGYDYRSESLTKDGVKTEYQVVFANEYIRKNPIEFSQKLVDFLQEYSVEDWDVTFIPVINHFQLFAKKKGY